jgi:hypothetical protein
MIEKYLTDSISRPQIEKKMLDGVILPPVKITKPEQLKTMNTGASKQSKIVAVSDAAIKK